MVPVKLYHFDPMKKAASALVAAALALSLGGCFHNLSEAELADPAVKARVETRLHAEKGLNLRYVDIDVHSRIVTISGIVDSREERDLIRQVVQRTPGVEQAMINLLIQE